VAKKQRSKASGPNPSVHLSTTLGNVLSQSNQVKSAHMWKDLLPLPTSTVLLPITGLCYWLCSWQGGWDISKWQEERGKEGEEEHAAVPAADVLWVQDSPGGIQMGHSCLPGCATALVVAGSPGDILVTPYMPESVEEFCWSHKFVLLLKVLIRFFSSN